jgi:hypothetical protein
MATNFDSINGDENLDNPLERKITTIEQALTLISQIIEQFKLSNSLIGFEFVRSNLFGTVFKEQQHKELQVIINSEEQLRWIMFLNQKLCLTVGDLDSNLSLALNNIGIENNIGILTIENGESKFIGDGKINYDTFAKYIIDLLNKFNTI